MVYLAIHLKWIQSSLENRMQQRPVHGSVSDSRVLTCFVPQGIILGPHLSLLLINDLPNCLSHCEPRMYADDTYLTYADNNVGSIESSLSEGLLNVNTWLNANKLTLNMTKTIYADRIWPKTFTIAIITPSMLLNGTRVKYAGCNYEMFDITTDDKLSWICHVENLAK